MIRRVHVLACATTVFATWLGCGGKVVVDGESENAGSASVSSSSSSSSGGFGSSSIVGSSSSGSSSSSGPPMECVYDENCPCPDGTVGVCLNGTCAANGCGGISMCECACTLFSGKGCSDHCTEAMNGSNVFNFCDGAAASDDCATCLEMHCGFTAGETVTPTLCE